MSSRGSWPTGKNGRDRVRPPSLRALAATNATGSQLSSDVGVTLASSLFSAAAALSPTTT